MLRAARSHAAREAASLVDLVQKICRGEPDPVPNVYSAVREIPNANVTTSSCHVSD